VPPSLSLLLAAVAIAALFVSARRAREVCVLSVREGRTLRLRGKLPADARSAIDDVLARARVQRAQVRILRGETRATLDARGLDSTTAQRLRNVLGTFSMARISAGQPLKAPNLGQRLGIAWLAWHLHARRTER
jgi:hypothetical protein